MPSLEDDNGVSYLKHHYHIEIERGLRGQENAQLNGRWAHYGAGGAGADLAQTHPEASMSMLMGSLNAQAAAVSIRDPEAERDEESRRQTEEAMLLYPWQRAFMERVMPIEWCHARYPKVYAQR